MNAELNIPLLLGGAGGELSDKAWLGENGVRVALQGHLPFQAAIKAVYDTLKALRDGVAPADLRDSSGVGGPHRPGHPQGRLRPADCRLPAIAGCGG